MTIVFMVYGKRVEFRQMTKFKWKETEKSLKKRSIGFATPKSRIYIREKYDDDDYWFWSQSPGCGGTWEKRLSKGQLKRLKEAAK